jgi:hypothetical protein
MFAISSCSVLLYSNNVRYDLLALLALPPMFLILTPLSARLPISTFFLPAVYKVPNVVALLPLHSAGLSNHSPLSTPLWEVDDMRPHAQEH